MRIIAGFVLVFILLPVLAQQSETDSYRSGKIRMMPNRQMIPDQKSIYESNVPLQQNHFLLRGASDNSRADGTIIGTTTYDLQSNSTTPNRLVVQAGGEIGAVWTGSIETAPGWPDRGSFYNYNDGSNWGSAPLARIEGIRTGWPNLVTLGGKELVVSHDFGGLGFSLLTESVSGSGSWSTVIPTDDVLFGTWPRLAADASTNTLHLLTANYDGANGNTYMLYHRSLDGGATWDITQYRLPGIDTAGGYNIMSAEVYNVTAQGSKVAVVAGSSVNDLAVWISNSNGDIGSWTRTRIFEFAFPNFDGNTITDLDMDGVADQVETNDGAHAVLLDNSGKVHVWSGAMFIIDDIVGDDAWNFFPGVSGMWYWNEDFGPDSVQYLDLLLDWDLSGDPFDGIGADLPNYGVGLTSMMGTALDPNTGHIYVVFPMTVEGTDFFGDPTNPAAQSFRDLFGMYSTDGGMNWSIPVNLTRSSGDFLENMFPSIFSETTGDLVHVLWQRDEEPGHSLEATPDPVAVNEIVYQGFDFSAFEPYKPSPGFNIDYSGDGLSAVFINTSTDAVSYLWDFGDGSLSNANNPSHVFPDAGNYTICLTATNVYGDSTSCNDLNLISTSIRHLTVNAISIYPNPAKDYIILDIPGGILNNARMEIFNLNGQLMMDLASDLNDSYRISTSELVSGLYFLKLSAGDALYTTSFSIEK